MLLIAVASMAVAACSYVLPSIQLEKVEVVVSPQANQDNPIALDVLIVYDKAMLDRVLMLTARQWFNQRDQFKRDFPTGYDLLQWELGPGQTAPTRPVPKGSGKAVASIVFADYVTPGHHRARLDTIIAARIHLNERDFTVQVQR